MDNMNTSSLDDTLKEILKEDDSNKNVEDKPKRGRRPKAQIEIDNKTEKENINTQDSKENADKVDNKAKLEPEVVPDTPLDEITDISKILEFIVEQPKPEVVEDTALDKLPDIPDAPKEIVAKKYHPRGEAIEAFSNETTQKKGSWIGRQFILNFPTPVFRAKHLDMKIKPYQGLVTVVEEPSDGFVKVEYLRRGSGLARNYILLAYLTTSDESTVDE